MIAAVSFRPGEVLVAAFAALGAQVAVVALFLLPPPAPVTVAISDDNARPLAVAITPVALLKKGSQNPGKLPTAWERKAPLPTKEEAAQPSPHADVDTPPKNPRDAGEATTTDASASATASAEGDGGTGEAGTSTTLGSAAGSDHGTETDPLKGRAADVYRSQLASWFLAHFQIRGKVPFETLKTLRAEAIVSIGDDRRMGGYSIISLSGNAAFDAEVEATMARVRASGGELPPPPPNYPDMLGKTLSVGFRCTVRSQCE